MNIFAFTGQGKRSINQDCFKHCSLGDEAGIFVVADGMGGYSHGEIAANVAANKIAEFVVSHHAEMSPKIMLTAAAEEANNEIAAQMAMLGSKAMGTVFVAVLIKNCVSHVAWLGDSRAILYRNGRILRTTTDHSLINELKQRRSVTPKDLEKYSSVVTRSLMGDFKNEELGYEEWNIEKGDIIALYSDGIYRQLYIPELITNKTILHQLEDIQDKMEDNNTIIRIIF